MISGFWPAAESTLMPCLMALHPVAEARDSQYDWRRLWHVHVNFQPIMKACLFDLQVLADELEFALQGDLPSAVRGPVQQVAEADQQTACSIDVFPSERRWHEGR